MGNYINIDTYFKGMKPDTRFSDYNLNRFNNIKNTPIKSSGKQVVVSKQFVKGDLSKGWKINGRPPASGYRYVDTSTGNSYKFDKHGNRILINNYDPNIDKNKQHDLQIARQQGYGYNNPETLNYSKYNRDRLFRTIDSTVPFNLFAVPAQAINYIANEQINHNTKNNAQSGSISFWKRHLGYDRNYDEMPVTGIRFSGDYNKDGSSRLPKAEYSGISKASKDAIRRAIKDGRIVVNDDGSWSQVNGRTTKDGNLEQFENFAIRKNNKSGIYDIFDTYDFENHWFAPNLNRLPGTQIEVRDTIWGDNPKPGYYNYKQSSSEK